MDLSILCPNGTFFVIDSEFQSLGNCFINTVLLAPSYLLFAAVNAYLFGSLSDLSRHYKFRSIKLIRFVSCLLVVFTLNGLFIKYFLYNFYDSNNITFPLITDCFKLISLSLHSLVIFNKSIFIKSFSLVSSLLVILLTSSIFFFNYFYLIRNKIYAFNLNSYEKFTFFYLLIYCLILFVYNLILIISLSSKKSQIINYTQLDQTNEIQTKSESIAEEDQANYLSYLTFEWLRPVMMKGYRQEINKIDHLSQIPLDLNVNKVSNSFIAKYWPKNSCFDKQTKPILKPSILLNEEFVYNMTNEHEDENLESEISKKSLASTLMLIFGRKFLILGVFKLINDIINFSGPLLLNQLVKFVENKESSLKDGCMFATALLLSTLVGSVISIHFTNELNKLCLRIKTTMICLIYRKAIKVRLDQLNKFSTGQIVNYMSIDTDTIVNGFPSFHSFWSLPFQIIITFYLLYSQIGISFLVGVVFVIILIPVNKVISDYISKVQQKLMLEKDSRVKLMNEFLNGIKVIKFYSWEKYFLDKIQKVRDRELKQLKTKKYLDAGYVYFWASTPILMSALTFSTYFFLDNNLTPSKVFTSLALFNMLISPLNSYPWVINSLVQAYVSFKRIQGFLSLKNLSWLTYYTLNHNEPNLVVDFKNAEFKWKEEKNFNNDNETHSILSNVNFQIKKGQLIGIVGKIGSGKTSLLHAIMSEIIKPNGKIKIDSNVCSQGFAYVGQDCWIKAGSIRENILFGSEMNTDLYEDVIDACALGPDLKILPLGDETFVGENGITLSGGQKKRLALSRACYAKTHKEFFLLDDPFSAVGAHVAKHIFLKSICGLLANKTRILCTHHIDYLIDADLVLVIENGCIVRSGPGSEIIPGLRESQKSLKYSCSISKILNEKKDFIEHIDFDQLNHETYVKRHEEEIIHGVIDFRVYKYYFLAVGMILTAMTLLSLTLMQTTRNLTDFWLSYWTQHHSQLTPTNSTDDSEYFFIIYGSLCASNSLCTLFRAFFFAYSGILAGKYIHKRLIDNISTGNLNFFQSTPSGKILNRISSDICAINNSLPSVLNVFLANIFGLLGVLLVTCYSLPWFSFSLIPLLIIYYNIQNFYRWTSRELKRLTSISLSPVYTHFHETLGGIITIRAFRQVERFVKENETKLSNYIRAAYVNMAAIQWLNFRLQMISVIMITAVGFTAVFQHIYGTTNASLVGLALSYILSVTGLLNGLITSFTETEKEMVSVERVFQFENIKSENWIGIEKISPDWPIKPIIEYIDVVLQYKEGVNALNGISFKINAGEKVGICGRSSSGKSSLFMALFRGEELESGQIKIDDVNIRNLSLNHLRQSISIIPQDPFLFNGTLRENLDPYNLNNETKLWDVLKKCGLYNKYKCDPAGLDSKIEKKGKNLSCGEKQLVCLARAMLTNRKILCIDEATASVDFETDRFIQQTIRDEFAHYTVLTIAHRIETILDYDRILVLDEGKLIEFDTPTNLLSNSSTIFYSLVNTIKIHN